MLEPLEFRRMLAVVAPFGVTTKGTLVVQGTTGNDEINVSTSGHSVTVSLNLLKGFKFSDVKRIRIEGAAGKDQIVFNGELNIAVSILGGAGNDRLSGSGPRVTLSGGDGDDKLTALGSHGITSFGGRGDDRLFASDGADTLSGGAGYDYAETVFPGDVVDGSIESQNVASP